MEPNIRDFSRLEKFIKENPKEADGQAFEWQQFLKANIQAYPELSDIETADEFYSWASEHPEKNIDRSIWVGKEVSDAYYHLRDQHEDNQMREEGKVDQSIIPNDLMGAPLLASSFLQRPKTIENDRDYQKIEEELKKEWLKNNNLKDFSSNEAIDYLYGSLDDPTKISLAKEAQESFRKNPKFQKRIERYDKEQKRIYKNHKDDPKWQTHELSQQMEINARLELLEKSRDKKIKISKEDIKKSQEVIIEKVRKKSQEEFTAKHPEKAKDYFEKVEAEKRKLEEKRKETSYSNISPSQLNKALQEAFQTEKSTQTSPPRTPSQPSLPTRTEGGEQVRGLRSATQAAKRVGAMLGRTGALATQTAGRGLLAFFATPPGWVTIGCIVLFTIVFVVVLTKGRTKFSSQMSFQEANRDITASGSASATPSTIMVPAEL